jgi:hypothetical protein
VADASGRMRRLQLRSMRRRRRLDRPARRLSVSIDALPRATKLAMLEGICETPIFVGAYTPVDGTCPMFAAHRRGGRTPRDVRARLDGYTGAERGPRPATEREPSRPCSRRVWPRRRDGAPATSGGRSARTARRVSAASSARRWRRTRRAGRGVPGRGAHRRRPPTDPPTGTALRVASPPGLGLAARLPTPRRLRGRNRAGRAWRGRAGPRRT